MMINKFSKINNLAVFSNYNWDSSNPEFTKINIIYGRNYSGKTTLSRILRAIETQLLPGKYENPSFEISLDDGSIISNTALTANSLDVRVFNEDFVRTNLRFLIDPDSEIEPFAILGSDNAEIEKAISDLEIEIGSDIEGNETGLHKQLKDKKKAAQDATIAHSSASSVLEKRLSDKATNKQIGIKYNPERFGDQNYTIVKVKTDIVDVTSVSYVNLTQAQKAEHEKTIIEQPKDKIAVIIIPNLGLTEYCNKAVGLLSRKIGASNKLVELLRDTALNEWVKKGQTLLSGKDVCAFCGNPISSKRWAEINAHFDEESKKLEVEIDELIEAINSEIGRLQQPVSIDKTQFYSRYHPEIDSFITARVQAISDYCAVLNNIIEQVNQRKTQITVEMAFTAPEENFAALITLHNNLNKIIKESNDYTTRLSTAKKAAQQALRLQEVADFCSTIDYTNEIAKIVSLKAVSDNAARDKNNVQILLNQKIAEKQAKLRQLNDEEEGARRVNVYLNDYFGHNFVSLEAENVTDGEKRIRFRIMRNDKPAYNLSEGECSLIAFCYFMAKLDDVNTQTKKPIIWIDDPISSLDGNHVFFIYSLLRAKLVETNQFEQLFVSTHNLDFLKYLKRLTGKENDRNIRYYIVQRIDTTSFISEMPNYLQKYVTEFNYLFHEIYKCSEISTVNDSNYMSFYNFGNNARKFLEILMFYNYPDDTKQLDKLEKFFGVGRIPAVLTDRINNEYSHLCGVFERGEVPTEVPEMLTTAKLIIETMKQKNAEQYSSLMQSVGVTASSA